MKTKFARLPLAIGQCSQSGPVKLTRWVSQIFYSKRVAVEVAQPVLNN
jgi:hypothetical protein